MLLSRPRSLAEKINNNQISLNISQLDRPSTSPVLSPLPIAHDFNKYNNWASALPGVELRLLRLASGVLSTWLQICGSYGHSTESQTKAIADSWSVILLTFQSSLQAPWFQRILFSPHAPVLSRSHEPVSQRTKEQQDVIPDLPQFWMVTYYPHAPGLCLRNNQ